MYWIALYELMSVSFIVSDLYLARAKCRKVEVAPCDRMLTSTLLAQGTVQQAVSCSLRWYSRRKCKGWMGTLTFDGGSSVTWKNIKAL